MKNYSLFRTLAQGIFSIFKLMRNESLPFMVGQVGAAFRNEISTGDGLIRTREFQMAEIEHFYDPNSNISPDFMKEVNLNTVRVPKLKINISKISWDFLEFCRIFQDFLEFPRIS